ncbi:FAD-dependent monooxygenase [Nocardia sp. BSTN01]|uniref:FAD-dependent monooxygenase n=1 Tax=Nocardia sp. BSTN01 TaxID=2783665 RepID=UPI0018903D77|nr:FAD-dependent monooxygenase [Nocardia sp. BSTN01]MBF5002401.1 FAD-dependent monooxygenase [Nocardia sp. BSTN01]
MTKQSISHALIAGGGIGGLAAAVALRRVGISSTVFERADHIRDGGAGLHIWSNGMLALAHLGLADAVREIAPAQSVAQFLTWRGGVLGRWPIGSFEQKYGQPTVAISRAALHGVLAGALPDVEIRTAARVTGYRDEGNCVAVEFADGTQARGDILIGADGVGSAVRAALLNDGPPRYNGYIAWRGHSLMHHNLIPTGTFAALFGPGTRFTYYDIAPGVVHWMSVANGPAGGRDNGSARDVAAMLADRHRGWVDPVPDILAASEPDSIVRGDVVDRPPSKKWGDGRVTLLGDAAHAITFNVGQGACQAIEDAAVLAQQLARTDDPVVALRAYEAERYPRTASMQRMAYWIGRLGAVRGAPAVAAREVLMKATWTRLGFRGTENDHVAYGTRWTDLVPVK